MAWLFLQVPVAAITWALWRMQLKHASQIFLWSTSIMLGCMMVHMAAAIYYGGDSLSKIRPLAVLATLPFCIILAVLTMRHFSRKRAWKVVAADAEAYDQVWERIAARQMEALQQIWEASHQAVMEIAAATSEGQQRHHDDAENLRRLLLQNQQRTPGLMWQSVGSLHLLYAQAIAVDGLFQGRCAEWANGSGKHVAGRIKQPSRAIQKVWRAYHGEARCLVDLVRASIVCEGPGDVLVVFRRILADKTTKILRIKNRFDPYFDSKSTGGYRNLSLNLIICDPDTVAVSAERHVCELQLALRSIDEMKTDGGHRRFVLFRDGRAE
eukprot:TRINITY_DN13481_c0_g1_i6.p1 TRINITY_DN13481_c0_g1~~TRINITY_DN13481_c0_g1_i6.p1  ORF type:complete len:325 (-),score=30.25 TRINITY_DN13481_c0_g1_i6:340-1314(-)